ncbi:Smg-4/UPF3 family-domain-containing protein [Zychaea mexicana]|uniref:Smg-4/UPF3 family-domain-containing protein n=1 Tax=Zychaea mexicana TaxID=64656 RepID=UPI0022FDBF8C|nr:Smg-4/UPF3 family-domain-containing protein [Zychaea mexicana]KAI9474808.1 Smg-4/UPF3 family-domain-containing protein [Zychaea mexicana]
MPTAVEKVRHARGYLRATGQAKIGFFLLLLQCPRPNPVLLHQQRLRHSNKQRRRRHRRRVRRLTNKRKRQHLPKRRKRRKKRPKRRPNEPKRTRSKQKSFQSKGKENVFSRAYFHMKSMEAVIAFHQGFDGHIFLDSKGTESRAVVEFAPFQKVPKEHKNPDTRQGTIDEG